MLRKTRIKEAEAQEIYMKLKPFYHWVWEGDEGRLYKRDPDILTPRGCKSVIRWLPYSVEYDENGKLVKTPIIDPMSFKEFVKMFKWRII